MTWDDKQLHWLFSSPSHVPPMHIVEQGWWSTWCVLHLVCRSEGEHLLLIQFQFNKNKQLLLKLSSSFTTSTIVCNFPFLKPSTSFLNKLKLFRIYLHYIPQTSRKGCPTHPLSFTQIKAGNTAMKLLQVAPCNCPYTCWRQISGAALGGSKVAMCRWHK